MTAGEVLHMLHARDIRLAIDGDRLRYDAPSGAVTDEDLTLLREHKPGLLALLREVGAPPAAPPAAAGLRQEPNQAQPALTPPADAWCCSWCHGTRRWRSVYDVLICATCHPPGSGALVRE